MGKNSGISWCDHTHNIAWGCDEVSPACDDCYARWWAERTGFKVGGHHGFEIWGRTAPRACVETEPGAGVIERREFLYGDWSPGRFAWRLENVRPLPKPIPLKGHQGFFYWPEGKQICAEAFN